MSARKFNVFQQWLIDNHPRVSYLKKAHQCAAMKGKAPLKVYWKRDGTRQHDEAVIAPWRCSTPAHWKFVKLKRSRFGQSGTYCYRHLWYRELFGDMDEEYVTEKLMVSTGYATPEQTITQNPEKRR